MPSVFSAYDKYREKGLVVIGIHVDAINGIDTVAKLDEKLVDVRKRLWKDRDLPFPVGLVCRTRTHEWAGRKNKAKMSARV